MHRTNAGATGEAPTTAEIIGGLERALERSAGSGAIAEFKDRSSHMQARFEIAYYGPEGTVLRDLGPWDQHPTITNDAEGVVDRVADWIGERRLFYIDSGGRLDELVVKDGRFAGFKSGAPNVIRGILIDKEIARMRSERNSFKDGDDPMVVMGQAADMPAIEDVEPVTLGRPTVIDEAAPVRVSTREATAIDNLNDALQILRTAPLARATPGILYRDADVDAIDKRIVNAIELLKAGAR